MIVLSFASPLWGWELKVSPGVSYFKFNILYNNEIPLKIRVLRVDQNKNITVKAALAKDTIGRVQATSAIAKRNGAIAAINGTFFNRSWPRLPIGFLVIDGKLIIKSLLNRSAIGISRKNGIKFGIPRFSGHVVNLSTGEKITVWGINRPRKEDEVIIYTPEYGPRTRTNDKGVEITIEDDMVVGFAEGNSQIPQNGYIISFHGSSRQYTNSLPPGAMVNDEMSLSEGWENYEQVITGGPRLIENGNIVCRQAIVEENFVSLAYSRKARTAIGINRAGNLLLIVVEKDRKRASKGVTYFELADIMQEIGAVDAIGLDGGGSSTMYVNGDVVNGLSKGYQEMVSNAIIVKEN